MLIKIEMLIIYELLHTRASHPKNSLEKLLLTV
jgi:hypothetical protein